jgi:hypothetical protein
MPNSASVNLSGRGDLPSIHCSLNYSNGGCFKGDSMLNHVVLLKFKSGVSNADIEELEKMLDDLPNRITEIHSYEFGRDVVRSQRSFDFALVSLFANVEALERYQQHRQHLPVLKKIKQLCENVVTVDFEGSNAGSIDIDRPAWDFKPI